MNLDDIPQTQVGDLVLYHPEVPVLGPGVASNVVALIETYARRAGLKEIPPITLMDGHFVGRQWGQPWEAIRTMEPCPGDAGSSYDTPRSDESRCLLIQLPDSEKRKERVNPENVEGTIAHEITHLRWWDLKHGIEFEARVWALLHGVSFPPPDTAWPAATRTAMTQAREVVRAWFSKKFGRTIHEDEKLEW